MKRFLKKIFYKFPSSYILMFHHIDDGRIIQKSGCVLDYKAFLNIISSDVQFTSVIDLIKNNVKYKVAVTFDDGLKDVYRVAYPELKKRGIPFTLFIVTDFLDKEGYISTSELVEMSKDPLVTVGSHGLTHKILKGMPVQEQIEELKCSKEILEKIIDSEVEIFAYSHGQFDDNTIRLLKKYKFYKYIFGVSGLPLNFITKRYIYNLPRFNCENGNNYFQNKIIKIVLKENKELRNEYL